MCQVPEGEVREMRRAAGVGGRVTGRDGGWRSWGGDNDIRCRRVSGWVDGGWWEDKREGEMTFNNSLIAGCDQESM